MKTATNDDKLSALSAYLDCSPDELKLLGHDHYGLATYKLGMMEYAIGTDKEADEACEAYVRDSIWAFNATFILEQCDLPSDLAPAIAAFQSKECESANDALLALVEKCTNLDAFTHAAISADGRGHFLSGYDGEENEAGAFFVYRIN
jgi:hypothetical protein